jgi:hypothetical protein
MNIKLTSICSALLSSMLIAGCGGGSDSTGGVTPPGTVATAVTVANADSTAAQAYAAISEADSQSTFATEIAVDFASGVSLTQQRRSLLDTSLALLYKKPDTTGNLVVGATVTENCSGGGTVTIIDTSTTLSISANNCREGDELINGSLSFSFTNMIGTPAYSSSWSATMALSFTNLSIQVSGSKFLVNGGMSLAYNQSSALASSANASGQSLHYVYTENGSTVLNGLLQSFTFSSTRNNSTYTNSGNFIYAASGSAIGATPVSFTVATTVPLVRTAPSYPHQGSLTATGANNSKVRLTALNSTTVQIEVDANGDGTYEHTSTTTWSALLAA